MVLFELDQDVRSVLESLQSSSRLVIQLSLKVRQDPQNGFHFMIVVLCATCMNPYRSRAVAQMFFYPRQHFFTRCCLRRRFWKHFRLKNQGKSGTGQPNPRFGAQSRISVKSSILRSPYIVGESARLRPTGTVSFI